MREGNIWCQCITKIYFHLGPGDKKKLHLLEEREVPRENQLQGGRQRKKIEITKRTS